jgi:prepilin-type N-terminal cleavage/methylation domain-containing protein
MRWSWLKSMRKERGMTLLEILATTVIFGLVASGLLAIFTFARTMEWRNRLWMQGPELAKEIEERLRLPESQSGLSLNPGVYADERMPFASDIQPTRVAALNLPENFRRFQSPYFPAIHTTAFWYHGDGRLYVVEGTEDLDQDGYTGLDLDGDGRVDLLRVRVKVQWTGP